MRRYTWLLLSIFCFAETEASTACDKQACAKVKEEIRFVEARMRSGYTRAQGERYEAKLRKLRTRRYQVCR